MSDIMVQMGPIFLGSRLKRLGERMQAGAATVIAEAGIPLLPGHNTIVAALRTAPRTVGELAERAGISQPGVTRAIGQLEKLGMVEQECGTDQRTRIVRLTAKGQECARILAADVWPRIGMAAEELLDLLDGDFLPQLARLEKALDERSIAERASEAAQRPLVLRKFDETLAREFHDINAEWIDQMFTMEDADRRVLLNPAEEIIAPGGSILFVEASGHGIVGTCALQKTGPDAFELTKMGVKESARGLKAGEFLLEAMIARAAELGAKTLYLLTNSKCAAAIHLYEKLGFAHDAGILAQYGARYARCNVAMRYRWP